MVILLEVFFLSFLFLIKMFQNKYHILMHLQTQVTKNQRITQKSEVQY